jgi:cytochrome b561
MTRYSKTMMALHWATALLIVICWMASEGGPRVRADPPVIHMALGLSILVLVVARLVARAVQGTPPPVVGRARWEPLAARIGHAVLYLFLIALPLSGWYAASRLGLPLQFGPVGLPPIAASVQGAPGLIAELHEKGGTIILWLAGLHAAIALWHQFARGDGTLERMAPM